VWRFVSLAFSPRINARENKNENKKEKGVYLEVQGNIGGAVHTDELVTQVEAAIASPAGVSVCQIWGTEGRV
jgi:primosomal replication protein N